MGWRYLIFFCKIDNILYSYDYGKMLDEDFFFNLILYFPKDYGLMWENFTNSSRAMAMFARENEKYSNPKKREEAIGRKREEPREREGQDFSLQKRKIQVKTFFFMWIKKCLKINVEGTSILQQIEDRRRWKTFSLNSISRFSSFNSFIWKLESCISECGSARFMWKEIYIFFLLLDESKILYWK